MKFTKGEQVMLTVYDHDTEISEDLKKALKEVTLVRVYGEVMGQTKRFVVIGNWVDLQDEEDDSFDFYRVLKNCIKTKRVIT